MIVAINYGQALLPLGSPNVFAACWQPVLPPTQKEHCTEAAVQFGFELHLDFARDRQFFFVCAESN